MDRVATGVVSGIGFGVLFVSLLAVFSYNPYQFIAFILDTSPEFLMMGAIAVVGASVAFGTCVTYLLEKFERSAKPWFIMSASAGLFLLSFYLTFQPVSFNIFSYISMNGFWYTLASMALMGAIIPMTSFLIEISLNSAKAAAAGSGGLASLIFSLGCPSCGSLVFSLIGITAGLSVLPLKGIELKMLSLAILYFSISKFSPARSLKIRPDTSNMGLKHMLAGALLLLALVNTGIVLSMQEKKARINANVESLRSTAQTLEAVFPELKSAKSSDDIIGLLLPSGTPDYSSYLGGITYDDPVGALQALTSRYSDIKQELRADRQKWERYINLAAAPRGISCEFCCGVGPQGITASGDLRCGCSHNVALQTLTMGLILYTDYSDAEILREVMIWKSKFFPGPMTELASKISSGNMDFSSLAGMVGGC